MLSGGLRNLKIFELYMYASFRTGEEITLWSDARQKQKEATKTGRKQNASPDDSNDIAATVTKRVAREQEIDVTSSGMNGIKKTIAIRYYCILRIIRPWAGHLSDR